MSRRTLVVLVLACAALGCAEVEPVVHGRTRATAELELDFSRRAGHPVVLVCRDEADVQPLARELEALRVEAGPGVTLLGVSPRDLVIQPSRALAERVEPAQLRREIGAWVAPFLQHGDIDGAVRGLVRGYTLALRSHGMLEGLPPLPPFLPAERDVRRARPHNTAVWGLPIALLVFAAGSAPRSRRRRARAVAEEPRDAERS